MSDSADWVIAVLEDVAKSCEKSNLCMTSALLERAIGVAAIELGAIKQARRSDNKNMHLQVVATRKPVN